MKSPEYSFYGLFCNWTVVSVYDSVEWYERESLPVYEWTWYGKVPVADYSAAAEEDADTDWL